MGEFIDIDQLPEETEETFEIKAIDFKNPHGTALRVEAGCEVKTARIWAKVAKIAVKRGHICVGYIFGDSLFWEPVENIKGVR